MDCVVRRFARLCWAWLPVLAWMSLILWMSSRSDLPIRTNPQTGETIRTTFTLAKLAHVFEYSVLALLLLRALIGSYGGLRLPLGAAAIATVVVCGLFGGLDELRQSLTPTREPRLADIALDTVSALAVCLLVTGWQRFRTNSRRGPLTAPVAGRPTASSPARPPSDAPPRPRAGEGIGG
jgi:VanZ family protein